MHRFAHDIITPKGKRYVAHATTRARAGTALFHLPHSLDEVHRILIMLLHAGGNGEDVKIKNDVFRWEIQLLGEQPIRTLGNGYLVVNGRCLTFLIKSHHHRRSTVSPAQGRLAQEFLFTALEADGVYDAFALQALKALLQHGPFGAVHHDGHTRNIWIRRQQVEKFAHAFLGIE